MSCVFVMCSCALRSFDMGPGDTVGMRGGTHLARVDLLAGEGVVVGTHIGGVGVILRLVVVENGWSREYSSCVAASDGGKLGPTNSRAWQAQWAMGNGRDEHQQRQHRTTSALTPNIWILAMLASSEAVYMLRKRILGWHHTVYFTIVLRCRSSLLKLESRLARRNPRRHMHQV